MKDINILSGAFEKIRAYIQENRNDSQPVVQFRSPDELKEVFDFKVAAVLYSLIPFLRLNPFLYFSFKVWMPISISPKERV